MYIDRDPGIREARNHASSLTTTSRRAFMRVQDGRGMYEFGEKVIWVRNGRGLGVAKK